MAVGLLSLLKPVNIFVVGCVIGGCIGYKTGVTPTPPSTSFEITEDVLVITLIVIALVDMDSWLSIDLLSCICMSYVGGRFMYDIVTSYIFMSTQFIIHHILGLFWVHQYECGGHAICALLVDCVTDTLLDCYHAKLLPRLYYKYYYFISNVVLFFAVRIVWYNYVLYETTKEAWSVSKLGTKCLRMWQEKCMDQHNVQTGTLHHGLACTAVILRELQLDWDTINDKYLLFAFLMVSWWIFSIIYHLSMAYSRVYLVYSYSFAAIVSHYVQVFKGMFGISTASQKEK
ncbi:hypothetical protein RFI_03576 [Reticulomyxa filosa]|uniref:Uncharacterized protein n=1 Tax=Reticulomyxa filosa TaxID=46433 RepID=X6P7B2_RETFI|nr:hypothetical protein RFI_03576 [Reticulomyxa filosa]|eukprot:ETO33527.1 hypothetical protein RFI_03576 [Reticulomyxa filosa]